MSHNIGQNLKGELGEIFVQRELSDFQLLRENRIFNVEISDRQAKRGGFYHDVKEYEDYCKKFIEQFGTLSATPDFLVEGTKIFIEVKTGKSAKLEKNQLEGFPLILKKGYRIFIIRPKLLIEKRKFEVIDFYCSEFLGKNKRTRTTLAELKELIREQLA